MKKTYQIHLRIEGEIIESLKKQASISRISLAELIRNRIRDSCQLSRIEEILADINKKIKSKQEV